MQTTTYSTSINRAYDATCISSNTTTWRDDATKLAASQTAQPLVWLEKDKWGQWKVIDLRPVSQ